MCGGKRHDSHSAISTGTATIKMIVAAPVSSAPNSQRGSSMKTAPRAAAAPPAAVATEFIATTRSRGTTCGSDADRPDETKRVNPLTINAATRIGRSLAPDLQQPGDCEHQQQAADVGADEHQPPVPTVQQRTGERSEQRVGQEEHGEGAGDGKRRRFALGVEQERPREAGREQAVAELTDHAQFQQPPELGQVAHRTP